MYLVFDTETTGLPIGNEFPRLVQIAWVNYDFVGNIISEKEYIIKPEGFDIPQEATRIHGITTARAVNEGVLLEFVLNDFNNDIESADFIVAHNMGFDEKIIANECARKNIENKLSKKIRICTMKESAPYCAIPGKNGKPKWPSLAELYMKLFNKGFEDAHNAKADVKACAKCFWELKNRGVLL
ncbi:3'-5' exonuclease [bacterium]|nr:3'-5' exonuclease [bacterium]